MKKKILSGSILAVVVCSFLIAASFENHTAVAKNDSGTNWCNYGNSLDNVSKYDKKPNKINYTVLKGKTAIVTADEIKKGIAFYGANNAVSKNKALELSIQYFEEYNALYEEAIRLGYNVTEKEISEYVNSLRKSFENAEVNESALQEYKQVSSCFANEDAYWKYLHDVYRKSIPIQKMNEAVMEKFYKENPDATDNEFDSYYQELKNNLVKKENYKQLKLPTHKVGYAP